MKLSHKLMELTEYLPNLLEHKDLLVSFAILIVLAFATSFTTSHLLLATHERQQTEDQMATMTSYLNTWRQKSEHINSATMRPIKTDQLDEVQMAILLNVQSHQLNLSSLKETGDKTEKDGKSYEMEFMGEYPQVIDCIEHFNVKDALIGIKELAMEMQGGKMRVRMMYKIYTK